MHVSLLHLHNPTLTALVPLRRALRFWCLDQDVAASHGTVWAGTERGRLFRYERHTGEISEAHGALGGGSAVARIYPDPRTRAALVFLRNADAFHARAVGPLRPRWVARLRGMRCAAATWVLGVTGGTAPNNSPVLVLGTALGSLFALSLDEDRERNDIVEKLWAAPGGECIDGVRVERVAGKFVAVVGTRSRLYTFFNADTLGSLFKENRHVLAVQCAPSDAACAMDMPLPSELQFMTGDSALASRRFVWAAAGGVTHAQVAVHRRRVPVVDGATAASSAVVASVVDKATISWSTLKGISGSSVPVSANLSAFHILVLYPASVFAFNQITGALSQRIDVWSAGGNAREERDRPSADTLRLLAAPAAGFARDVASDVLWVFSEDGQLVRIVAGEGEPAAAWRAAQEMGRFDLALALAPLVGTQTAENDGAVCSTTRHAVLRAQADHAAADGDWESAVRLFAKTEKPIESVITAIVEACGGANNLATGGGNGAVKMESTETTVADMSEYTRRRMVTLRYISEYLVRKLDEIVDSRHAQRTLIAMVLVHLYAVRIAGEVDASKRGATRKDFFSFLADHYADLDVATALALLAQHNCLEESRELCRLVQKPRYALRSAARGLCVDNGVMLLEHVTATGNVDAMKDAVATLAQRLSHVDPQRIAQALVKLRRGSKTGGSEGVQHMQLLSALARIARFSELAQTRSDAYKSAVDYVRCVMASLQAFNTEWHQLVKFSFALHVELGDEGGAAESVRTMLAPHRLRPPHAVEVSSTLLSVLRVCLRARFRGVCVSLYFMLGLDDAAVKLALDVDVALAERTLRHVEADGELGRGRLRQLWRQLAGRSDRPVDVVVRSHGVLRIEDALQNMNCFITASERVKNGVALALREHRTVAHSAREGGALALNATDELRVDLGKAREWRPTREGRGIQVMESSQRSRGAAAEEAIDSLDRPFLYAELELPLLGAH